MAKAAERTPPLWSVDTAHAALDLDTRIYSVDSILRAAYKLTDRCYLLLTSTSDSNNHCTVFIGLRTGNGIVDPLIGEFANELIDQQIRERLEKQFGDVRTLIVAQAFSEGNLLESMEASNENKHDD